MSPVDALPQSNKSITSELKDRTSEFPWQAHRGVREYTSPRNSCSLATGTRSVFPCGVTFVALKMRFATALHMSSVRRKPSIQEDMESECVRFFTQKNLESAIRIMKHTLELLGLEVLVEDWYLLSRVGTCKWKFVLKPGHYLHIHFLYRCHVGRDRCWI